MGDARPGEPLAPVRISDEVAGADAFELISDGDVGDAFDLHGDLVIPADDQRDARVVAEVAVLAGGRDGVEDDFEGAAHGEADDRGLGGAGRGDGGLDGEGVVAGTATRSARVMGMGLA
jgi:hypothetical protein